MLSFNKQAYDSAARILSECQGFVAGLSTAGGSGVRGGYVEIGQCNLTEDGVEIEFDRIDESTGARIPDSLFTLNTDQIENLEIL